MSVPSAFESLTDEEKEMWTCQTRHFGSLNGCQCECGLVDPDCETQGDFVFYCVPQHSCDDEGCCIDAYGNRPTDCPGNILGEGSDAPSPQTPSMLESEINDNLLVGLFFFFIVSMIIVHVLVILRTNTKR